jgi:hypothetical protein
MLRHDCGYALANKGHDTRAIQGWLGHRSITSTAVYTAPAPNRFKGFLAGGNEAGAQLMRVPLTGSARKNGCRTINEASAY